VDFAGHSCKHTFNPINNVGQNGGDENMTTKEKLKEIIEEQPEDATYEEIVRELAFAGMVDRGIKDARQGRLISNEEMGKRIRLWQK
jgi:hypothetical protein